MGCTGLERGGAKNCACNHVRAHGGLAGGVRDGDKVPLVLLGGGKEVLVPGAALRTETPGFTATTGVDYEKCVCVHA